MTGNIKFALVFFMRNIILVVWALIFQVDDISNIWALPLDKYQGGIHMIWTLTIYVYHCGFQQVWDKCHKQSAG